VDDLRMGLRNPIQCKIEDEIERACRSSIMRNLDYFDDEQLPRERQFEVLISLQHQSP
jgi:hypothetical protein